MPQKGLKRKSNKAKDKFHVLALEAIRSYGSCSSAVLFDYAKRQHPTNQRWLPLKSSVYSWMMSYPEVYRGSDGNWRLKIKEA